MKNILKNKKRSIAIGVLVLVATALFANYYSNYHSVEELFLKIDLADSNINKNINNLQRFGEKNNYARINPNKKNGKILLTNLEEVTGGSKFTQLVFNSSEEDGDILTFSISDPEHISTVNEGTFREIKEGDSLKKAVNLFGIPSTMIKDKDNIIKATWLWDNQLFAVELTLENGKITKIII